MKKRILAVWFIAMITLFSACAVLPEQVEQGAQNTPKINYSDNLKAVWLSYYEIGTLFEGLDKQAAAKKADEIFADLSEKGINTVFFHVRAFADAFYDSAFFPRTTYCSDNYDLLALALESSHQNNISLHAWVNPYRVALNQTIDELPQEHPAVKLYRQSPQHLLITKQGIFFNPASDEAKKLILNGIRELVQNYDIDGVHFDDYFYPDTQKSLDAADYAAYKNAGGTLSLEQFRCEQVTALVESANAIIKAENGNLLFGISPQCSVQKNKQSLFADVLRWLELRAIDYIMPQIYFGFENENAPFEKSVKEWKELMQNKHARLYIGLALYKSGKEDAYASQDSEGAARFEWQRQDDIIARQLRFLKSEQIAGFTLYSYTSLVYPGENENLQKEVQHLLKELN